MKESETRYVLMRILIENTGLSKRDDTNNNGVVRIVFAIPRIIRKMSGPCDSVLNVWPM